MRYSQHGTSLTNEEVPASLPKIRTRTTISENAGAKALISPLARIHPDVKIGPFAIIGPDVSIAKGTIIGPHCIIEGLTTIGENNQIGAGSIIGGPPQDIKYDGSMTRVIIGNNNSIREYVTINRGSTNGCGVTKLGDGNLLMTSSHVGHDVEIGNQSIIGHGSLLGGHVKVHDYANISALCGIHQFCTVGKLAMVGASSLITKDIAPYTLVKGNPPRLGGLNTTLLQRQAVSPDIRKHLKEAYKLVFLSNLLLKDALSKIEKTIPQSDYVDDFVAFIKKSKRGIYR